MKNINASFNCSQTSVSSYFAYDSFCCRRQGTVLDSALFCETCSDSVDSGSAGAVCTSSVTRAGKPAPLIVANEAQWRRTVAADQSENDNVALLHVNNGDDTRHVGNHVCFVLQNESLFGAPDSINDSDSNASVVSIESNENNNTSACDKNRFSFLSWNVEGLYPKFFDDDFLAFVTSYDFV